MIGKTAAAPYRSGPRERGWMMKNLLAVIGDGSAGPVLEASLKVAKRFNSHIVGLHSLTTEYAVVFGGEMGFSISSEVDRTLEREGHERRDQARRLFRDFMTQQGVPLGPAADHAGPSASWREEDGRQNAVVGMSGRVYDLILVEQPEKLASIAEATLEDALFESGRPVMMVPKVAPAAIGECVAVAWNGSTETATTVALAMPFLDQAKEIVVVAVGPQHMPEPGPTGDELARTQGGNNNAYAQDNDTTWIDWRIADAGLVAFVARLAAVRRAHRSLNADRFLSGTPLDAGGVADVTWLRPDGSPQGDADWADSRTLGVAFYCGAEGAIAADRTLVWINGTDAAVAVTMPAVRNGMSWWIEADSSDSVTRVNNPSIPPRSVVIFAEAPAGRH